MSNEMNVRVPHLYEILIQCGAFGVVAISFVYLLQFTLPHMQEDFAEILNAQRQECVDATTKWQAEFMAHSKEIRAMNRLLWKEHTNNLNTEIRALREAITLHTAAISSGQGGFHSRRDKS